MRTFVLVYSHTMMKGFLVFLLFMAGVFPASASVLPREVRAVWLTTLSGLDWPSRPATTAAGFEQQRQELRRTLDSLRAVGINTLLFQTRVRSTVVYPSAIEPWDGVFTGRAGQAPDYDPLQVAVDECHRRGMELHAWVVAFPAGSVAAMRRLGRKGLPQRRPELCRRCGDQWLMDPGVPATAEYLAALCGEIVRRYDVDGLHLDYIRYPEREIPFNDRTTYRRYGGRKSLAEWRRANVTRCVQAIHDTVKALKPWVKLSCSPVGKHADLARYSSRGWNARDAVFQDAQVWLRQGLMDMLFPMMYFTGDHFYPFAADWQEQSAGRLVVPGLGIYMLSPRQKDWPLGLIERELHFVRHLGMGQAYFRSRFLTDDVKGVYRFLAEEFYTSQALPPAMTWVDSVAPDAPAVALQRRGHALNLSWPRVYDNRPGGVTYNVYVDEGYGPRPLSLRQTDTVFRVSPVLPVLRRTTYLVTAMDRYGNESRPACVSLGRTPAVLPSYVVNESVALPPCNAEFILVTDATGRHVFTARPSAYLGVARLAPGFYTVRTLDARGRSHVLTTFVKELRRAAPEAVSVSAF